MYQYKDPKTGFVIHVTKKDIAHMYIRVKEGKRVEITAPTSYSQERIEAFVVSRTDWLKKHVASVPEKKTFRYIFGEVHRVFDKPYPLEIYYCNGNVCFLEENRILMGVVSDRSDCKRIFAEGMKDILLPVLQEMVDHWSKVMGVKYGKVSCRVLKSRWGSCDKRTYDLCFALDLVTKPKELIELVVVHELNHILEGSHQKRFHDLMAHWIPDYKERGQRLMSMERELI